MKRDFEVIRYILTALEEAPTAERQYPLQLTAYPADIISYHLWLLIQSGLIVGACNKEAPYAGNFQCYGVCLTWAGHEFLGAIRSDSAWKKIRHYLAERTLDLSYETIKAAAQALLGLD